MWNDNTWPSEWKTDNSVKTWENFPISNPKPDCINIYTHTMFGENPLIFTQIIVWNWKYGGTDEHKIDWWPVDRWTDQWRTDKDTNVKP